MTFRKSVVSAILAALSCIGVFAFAAAQIIPRQTAGNIACLSNLKHLGLSALLYAQDYDDMLPPLSDPARVWKGLIPYLPKRESGVKPTMPGERHSPREKLQGPFFCPTGQQPYVVNRKFIPGYVPKPLAFPLAAIPTWSKTVLFYDPKPHPDRSVGVTYTDGHARREKKLPPLGLR